MRKAAGVRQIYPGMWDIRLSLPLLAGVVVGQSSFHLIVCKKRAKSLSDNSKSVIRLRSCRIKSPFSKNRENWPVCLSLLGRMDSGNIGLDFAKLDGNGGE